MASDIEFDGEIDNPHAHGGGMGQFSWGLDRIDMQDAGPFHAYGDGFLGGVAEARIGMRLEIIYIPLGEPEPVDGLAVADVETMGFVLHAGYILG